MSVFMVKSSRIFHQIYPYRSWLSSQKHQTSVFSRNLSTKNKKNTAGWGEWKGIFTRFVPVGICLIAVMQWRVYRRRHQGDETPVAKQWEINCYCMLPLRTVSRCWGWLAEKHLPEFFRPILYKLYSHSFGVNIHEALNEDLTSYPCLADFFARPLKNGIRKIDEQCDLVSPCDGTVLHFGTVNTGQVEQVKGVTYSLKDFLGEKGQKSDVSHDQYRHELLHQPHKGNTLYQCVIYLAPGDYHRFHSPADWQATHRRHFSGELLSVNPSIASWLPGLFCLNERAVYLGHWDYGFFSYTAVGATNVGTVKVYFDKTLQTNQRRKSHKFKELCLGSAINLKKGDLMGEFRMGSTIVLLFEAPYFFNFQIVPGQKILVGQSIGCVEQQKFVDRIDDKKTVTSRNAG